VKPRTQRKLGFVGAGKMAGALLRGVLEARLYRPKEIWIADPVVEQRRSVHRRFGVGVAADNHQLVRGSRMVVLAVKPQIIDDVLAEIRGDLHASHLVVSIAAGVTLRRLSSGLGGHTRVVRTMPNTPALLGKGMSVMVRAAGVTQRDLSAAMRLFRAVGDAVEVTDEGLLDPVTGLSGSGPAYVYRFAEALIEAGVRQGLPADASRRLVFRTLEGASAMLLEAGNTPKELREMVSSPGGTTVAGLAALEQGRFADVVCGAVAAATFRSRELGGR
jgi:pyrroline-5-carboxylate reductase